MNITEYKKLIEHLTTESAKLETDEERALMAAHIAMAAALVDLIREHGVDNVHRSLIAAAGRVVHKEPSHLTQIGDMIGYYIEEDRRKRESQFGTTLATIGKLTGLVEKVVERAEKDLGLDTLATDTPAKVILE